MFKKISKEFRGATYLEKFNTVASLFTVSGLSMLTIFNAVGGINYEQVAVALFVFGTIFLLISILMFFSFVVMNLLKKESPLILQWIFGIGVVLLNLGFLVLMVINGIELINSFGG